MRCECLVQTELGLGEGENGEGTMNIHQFYGKARGKQHVCRWLTAKSILLRSVSYTVS